MATNTSVYQKPWFWLILAGVIFLIIYFVSAADNKNRGAYLWLAIILLLVGLVWWMVEANQKNILEDVESRVRQVWGDLGRI